MKKDGLIFCDSAACTESDKIIHPKDEGHLNYGKVDYHAGCYVDYLRKHKAIPAAKGEEKAVLV